MLRNVQTEELTAAILTENAGIGEAMARRLAQKVRDETDERLEKNVLEWLEKKEISKLVLGDYSIQLIMQIRGNNDFLGALLAMNDYLADPELGARKIWRAIR